MGEHIAAVAIWLDGRMHRLEPPGRHHHLILRLAEGGYEPIRGWQGFVTDTGRFVDRHEACRIAREAGQIKKKTGPEDELFSEDMW